MREVRTGYTRFKRNATKLKKHLIENFTEENMYNQFCDGIVESAGVVTAKDQLKEIDDMLENLL